MNGTAIAAICLAAGLWAGAALGAEFHVSPAGSDTGPGTKDKPFATLAKARDAVRAAKAAAREPVTVWLHAGTYYLPETLVLAAGDSGTKQAPVVYAAVPGEEAVISGGSRLDLKWEPHQGGILKAKAPAGLATDQLFINGQRQHLARYPNFDPNVRIFNGYAKDAISPERAKRWADPRGGFIHAMHRSMWGGMHFRLTGKDADGNLTSEGGWQNNRPAPMHPEYRFVENIFEELDAPGEWFLDAKTAMLYFYPPQDLDLAKATVEGVRLRHLIEVKGTEQQPVKFVTFRGLVFRHAARTFMDNKEPLLRSDWTTYRGGAVFFSGAEDCTLEDCYVDQVGGNAVFVNNYNRRIAIRGCHIARAGANGVAFVGDPGAVRSATFWNQNRSLGEIDKAPGPKTGNYPADCLVEDCLIHLTGRVEKQTAPVEIAMSQGITVRHCSLYDVPRAGINIGDGCWGGHVIEFCDIFDTVKETGDHGSFNSWGRDRYWGLKGVDLGTVTLGDLKQLPVLDAVKTTVMRNNRWRCDHGWDIDLDDGSTNYHIYNNLCLNGGIKLREGFFRVCENNIMVSNSFNPHVWYGNSQDVFRRNIVFGPYRPIRVNKPWGKECDANLLHKPGQKDAAPAKGLQQQSGLDEHSLEADAMFIDPGRGDYRVKDGSPALALGFKNFPMDQFGVRKPDLKKIARTPVLPGAGDVTPAPRKSSRDGRTRLELVRDGRQVLAVQ
ncbi:MAG: right-handed parallel beta-helix repeat-containing protein [Planctomycetota bacterium]|nr:right-handed parallel beta-helix repeat-containing protein [Planctomycetota bacterium]